MSAPLLSADTGDDLARLVTRLSAKAAAIGRAHIVSRNLTRHGDERRWRRADLLWPTGKG